MIQIVKIFGVVWEGKKEKKSEREAVKQLIIQVRL